MLILDLIDTCNDPALSTTLASVKNIMLLIQIIVPIALLIGATVEFAKLTINPEEKDGFRKILNKVIAALIVFIIPLLVNLIMGVVGESTQFTNCWNNASFDNGEAEYIE